MQEKLLPFQGPRLIIFVVAIFITFGVLISRLYDYQFTEYDRYLAAAQDNAIESVPLPAPRGVIYDRNGMALALNAPAFTVEVIPAYMPEEENALLTVLNRLAALINVPATDAASAASGRRVRSLQAMVDEGLRIAPYRSVAVATDVEQSTAQIILEDINNLPGVQVRTVSVRQYPGGESVAQIIGYLGPIGEEEAELLREQGYNPAFERVGYAGVEAYLETELAGQRGLLTRTVDVAGLPINVIQRQEPQAGQSLRLTIDMALQRFTEQALSERINFINADAGRLVTTSGVVIAMNPQTGEILAMVSLPTYDNQRFARNIDVEYYQRISQEAQTPLVNHAYQSLYPPGSVWKLVTAAGVLEEEVIDPNTQLNDPGELWVENTFAENDAPQRQRFVCWLRTPTEARPNGGHGLVNMIQGIAWSCDVYFYQIGGGNPDPALEGRLRPGGLGIEDLYRYATAFNIGVETGIELPFENPGQMPDRTWKRRVWGESWSTGDTYNAAFGQGYVVVSPLQLLISSAALANGGYLFQPTVIREWLDAEGNVIEPFQPRIHRSILLPTDGSPAVLNFREDMLIQGKNSLVCTCEPNSPYRDPENAEYDPDLPDCDREFVENYQRTVTLDDAGEITYRVNVPYGYIWGGVCSQRQINDFTYQNYQPPFVSPENVAIVQQGMRQAVIGEGGTARPAGEGRYAAYEIAGKTGTAEYCDDIAAPQGLCIPGEWPSHAWFFGYAPFSEAEIAVIAFVYNAEEGSANALPVVTAVIDCYFQLKSQRELSGVSTSLETCNAPQTFVSRQVP